MYEKFFTRVDLSPRIRDQERRAKVNMYFTMRATIDEVETSQRPPGWA